MGIDHAPPNPASIDISPRPTRKQVHDAIVAWRAAQEAETALERQLAAGRHKANATGATVDKLLRRYFNDPNIGNNATFRISSNTVAKLFMTIYADNDEREGADDQ